MISGKNFWEAASDVLLILILFAIAIVLGIQAANNDNNAVMIGAAVVIAAIGAYRLIFFKELLHKS